MTPVQEEQPRAKPVLALLLVGLIGLTGLVLMFSEASPTGAATQLSISKQSIAGCNAGEVLLSARGLEALRQRGREAFGPEFSLSSDAHVNYNGVGYCADAAIVRQLFE
jgi:hypothetical protein